MKLTQYPRLGEAIYTGKLENGLTVAVVPRPGFTKSKAYFVTDYGSIHTRYLLEGKHLQSPAGVAHYLEHKLFELPDRDVTAEFAAMGANVNAFTSYDMTAYYFGCTEHFYENLRLLLEFVSTPYFPEESVLREQGIIDQEIGMCADSPDNQVFEQLMDAMYETHPIRVPILGTSQTIRQITPQVLTDCHRAFYAPGNMILCVVGDVDPDKVARLALEVLGKENRPVAQKLTPEEPDIRCCRELTRKKMEVSMPNFQLGFKCEGVGTGEDAIRQEIVGDLAAEALFGESSELYLQLYERGLIDSSFGGGFETLEGCALLTCGGDSEEPEAVRDAILTRAAELAKTGVDETDFLRMKRSSMGRRIRDLDSFESTCFRVCAYHFGKFDYFRFPEVYDRVTQEEVQEFLKRVVTRERSSLSVIDPL